MPLIREAVRAFDLPCLEQGGFEADDLIATYAREAGERGATTTIVSSDKDLMQLVTDKVTMFDTMKDRRIGIAEVIEKFGVPPEKVVEVQALAGDSTDNVPGVPGIGVKTAAQLIVEYGDLETLLKRAGEIKQPKRREALIENAEKARISRKLVLLDDRVKLDVPLDELAVHEPDARKLIAFLKAMEFSTLTRRVAEYSQIDPSDVEADADDKSGLAVLTSPVRRVVLAARAPGAASGGLFAGESRRRRPTPPSPQAGEGAHQAAGERQGRRCSRARRISLAAARAEAARKLPVERGKYQTIRSLEELNACIARVHDTGQSRSRSRRLRSIRCRPRSAALRWRSSPTTPATSRSPTSSRATAPACSPRASRPDQIKTRDALAVLRPLLESAGILKIGFNVKFNAVMFAQHGITLRNHDDAQLMSYALDAGRNAHGLDALAETWLGHATSTTAS